MPGLVRDFAVNSEKSRLSCHGGSYKGQVEEKVFQAMWEPD